MLTDDELRHRLHDIEAFNVERTESARNQDKLGEAICAFANDLPDSRAVGVLFVGARDDGACAGLDITDQLLRTLMGFGRDGQILPLPQITVRKVILDDCVLAVVEVMPPTIRRCASRGAPASASVPRGPSRRRNRSAGCWSADVGPSCRSTRRRSPAPGART
jgi:ATP-dependent DNA helicase RecG